MHSHRATNGVSPTTPEDAVPGTESTATHELDASNEELTAAAKYLEGKIGDTGLTDKINSAVAAGNSLGATNTLADAFIIALDLPIDEDGSLEGCMQELLHWVKKVCSMDNDLVDKICKGLCQGVSKDQSKTTEDGNEDPGNKLRLKCMALLYNSVGEEHVAKRFSLLAATIGLAADIGMMSKIVDTVLTKVDACLRQWKMGVEEKRQMYKVCYEALKSADMLESAFAFNVKQLGLYNGASDEECKSVEGATVDVIVQAVRLEKLYRFDTLLELDVVKRFETQESDHKLLFELISIFVRDDLAVFTEFRSKNESLLAKYEIDIAVAEKKMRLLTFASLGIDSPDLTYKMIASALQISEDQVEDWVIRAISSGLVDAKINQLKSSVAIYRSTQRMFTREEWQPLSERINIWKENIGELLTSLRETRQSSGRAAVDAFSG